MVCIFLPMEKAHRRESLIGIYPCFQLYILLYMFLSEQTEALKSNIGSSYGKLRLTDRGHFGAV